MTDRVQLRADDLRGRPVVSLAGEDIAEIADVVHDSTRDAAVYTLRTRGLFGSELDAVLHDRDVVGLGPDAVVVAGEHAFTLPDTEGDADARATSEVAS